MGGRVLVALLLAAVVAVASAQTQQEEAVWDALLTDRLEDRFAKGGDPMLPPYKSVRIVPLVPETKSKPQPAPLQTFDSVPIKPLYTDKNGVNVLNLDAFLEANERPRPSFDIPIKPLIADNKAVSATNLDAFVAADGPARPISDVAVQALIAENNANNNFNGFANNANNANNLNGDNGNNNVNNVNLDPTSDAVGDSSNNGNNGNNGNSNPGNTGNSNPPAAPVSSEDVFAGKKDPAAPPLGPINYQPWFIPVLVVSVFLMAAGLSLMMVWLAMALADERAKKEYIQSSSESAARAPMPLLMASLLVGFVGTAGLITCLAVGLT